MIYTAKKGRRYHFAESQLQVVAPTGRTHAFNGDNCPSDSYVQQCYVPFTWCGLHVDYTYTSESVPLTVVPCVRCRKPENERQLRNRELLRRAGITDISKQPVSKIVGYRSKYPEAG